MTGSYPAFPAIAIARAGHLEVHGSAGSLETGYSKAIRHGWYEGMVLLWSDDTLTRVRAVRTMGGAGPFWGFSFTYSRLMRLEFTLDEPAEVSLEAAKALVAKAMSRAPHIWESAVDSSLEEQKRRVAAALSVSGIAEVLGGGR